MHFPGAPLWLGECEDISLMPHQQQELLVSQPGPFPAQPSGGRVFLHSLGYVGRRVPSRSLPSSTGLLAGLGRHLEWQPPGILLLLQVAFHPHQRSKAGACSVAPRLRRCGE